MNVKINQLIDRLYRITEERREKHQEKSVQTYVSMLRPLVAKELGFSLLDYFKDPEVLLEKQLEWKIMEHELFPDDRLIDMTIGIDFGTVFEGSLFGCDIEFRGDTEPWNHNSVVNSIKDIEKMEYPDFYQSGLMPQLHQIYQELTEMVEGKLEISFPGFARGPWSVATMLRGFNGLFLDLIDNPELVHKLMGFITESRIHWEKERAKFLGIDYRQRSHYKYIYADYRAPTQSDMYNDEVNGDMFSPAVYQEYIYPYEKRLADFYGETRYYHSCGNLLPFLDKIKLLPGIEMIHISAFTDLKKALEIIKPEDNIIIQKVMHPYEDVLGAKEEEMYNKICQVLDLTKDYQLYLCCDTIGEGPIEKAQTWLQMAKRAIADRR